jgi:Flp pilus assembly protein TadD
MTTFPLPPRPQQMTVADAYREALRLDSIGQYTEAQKICAQLLKAKPDHVDIHHLLGVIAFHAGRNEDAIRHLKHALKLKSDMPEASLNLAKVYRHKARWRDCVAALGMAARSWPDRADIITDTGYAHEMLGDEDQAAACYERALRLDPAAVTAHSNLGAILTRRGNIPGAERHLRAALSIKPTMAVALMNLAMLHDVADHRAQVIETYERLLGLEPEHAHAHVQRALALLCQGRLAEGWTEYLWRFRRPESRTLHAAFPYPFWQGEQLEGRKLLVWTEQGPGDEILLGSMIPDLLERGIKLVLVCSPRLAPLFRRSFKNCTVIANDRLQRVHDPENRPDVQASFSHLGQILRPTVDAFPRRADFLTAKPDLRLKLRMSYQSGNADTKLVGIAWHSANAAAEKHKSVPLENWGPILSMPDVRFVSLQYGNAKTDIRDANRAFGCEIVEDKSVDPLKDIDSFAAQVAAMDHVVSVSNTTVHVSGSLGVPTSTLVPAAYGRIWYWFLDRAESPWYPSMRLFRQKHGESWAPTVAAAAEALATSLRS